MSFPRSSYSGFPFDVESEEFPFNARQTGDSNLRSTLDNIAQRHPELAEHLTKFQSPRPRTRKSPSEGFKAGFRRPFDDDSRFPFGDDDIDFDHCTKEFYNPPEERQPSDPPTRAPEPSKTPEKELNSNLNLQQSNTTDLGQRQEPLIDDRNQRSMSAPPGGEAKKKFTSSINIPINNPPPPPENMAHQNQDLKPNERIIPIQIEGRDDPIIPKNTHVPQQSQPQTRPEQVFGQRPESARSETFVRRGFPEDHFSRQAFPEDHFSRQAFPEDHFSRHNVPPNFQQRDFHSRESEPVQKETPKNQHEPSKPQPQEEVKPEPPKPMTPIDQIQKIQQDVSKLMQDVEVFNGKPKDKQYLYLDEMLTRNLLKLDNIDTQGQENIRASRKEAIKCIQQAISLLENKAAANLQGTESQHQKPESTASENKQDPNQANPQSDDIKKEDIQTMDEEPSEKMDVTETPCNSETRAVLVTDAQTRAVLVSDPQGKPESKVEDNVPSTSENNNEKKGKKDKKGKKKEE